MKSIIGGSRGFNNSRHFLREIPSLARRHKVTEVVCGQAPGPDTWGKIWATYWGIPVADFPADWGKYGSSGGPIRNGEMANYADALFAFWDGKYDRSGTCDMIKQAIEKGLHVHIVLEEEPDHLAPWQHYNHDGMLPVFGACCQRERNVFCNYHDSRLWKLVPDQWFGFKYEFTAGEQMYFF